MNHAMPYAFLVALAILFCGCQTMPPVTAASRPEVKIVDNADAQRRRLVPPKTHFYSRETVAICVHGFSGRTVTLELWEQKRGLMKTWNQYIAPPHVRTDQRGMVYEDNLGFRRMMPSYGETQIENDFVFPVSQLPPGTYQVRVVSNDGIVQQASFNVSN